jgi:hypothetical protein
MSVGCELMKKKTVEKEKSIEEELKALTCLNPFRRRSRTHNRIAVFIRYKRTELPVCANCWERIGSEKSDIEWSSERGWRSDFHAKKD